MKNKKYILLSLLWTIIATSIDFYVYSSSVTEMSQWGILSVALMITAMIYFVVGLAVLTLAEELFNRGI